MKEYCEILEDNHFAVTFIPCGGSFVCVPCSNRNIPEWVAKGLDLTQLEKKIIKKNISLLHSSKYRHVLEICRAALELSL